VRDRLYKPNAVRRGANYHQTPPPARCTRGLTAGRLSRRHALDARRTCV